MITSIDAWLRHLVLDRPIAECHAILRAADSPEGAVIRSDLYRQDETAEIDQAKLDEMLGVLAPHIEAHDYYMGFRHDEDLAGTAAIYKAVVGPGYTKWVAVISEGDTDMEIRVFSTYLTASAFIAATLLLGEQDAEDPIAWSTLKSSITP